MKVTKKEILRALILSLLIIVPGITPYGLIPLGLVNLTILHIPVIIGAIVLKRGTSLILGLIFGLVSTLAAFGLSFAPQSGAISMLLSYSAPAVMIVCIIPRLLIPMATRVTFDRLKKHTRRMNTAVSLAALAGALTNTVAYLVCMGVFYGMYNLSDRFSAVLSPTLGIGVLCEALAAVLITNAIAPMMLRADARSKDMPEVKPITDEELSAPISEDISSVDEISVAVIPSMDMLLPKMDEIMQRKHDRCIKYLDDDNTLMADRAFDAFLSGFRTDDEVWGASVYAVMCFVEKSKYKTAADRLCRMLRRDVTPAMLASEHKQVVLGVMNIIHTSVVNDIGNPVAAQTIEHVFRDAGDLLSTELFCESADKFAEYIEQIGAYDRVIKRDESYEPKYENVQAAQATVREISDDEMSEGISAADMAVVPTAAGVELSPGTDFTQALKMLMIGADASDTFEAVISGIGDENARMEADRFCMLTYFERNDYVHALYAIRNMMARGYSTDVISKDIVKSTVKGIFTIAHAALRTQNPEKASEADRIMQKIGDFFDKGMIILCVQLLEKYFLTTGLAK